MKTKFYRKTWWLRLACGCLLVFWLAGGGLTNRATAQGPTPPPPPSSPAPAPTPNQVGLNLADYLKEFVKYSGRTRDAFISTVEKPLGGWFDNLAWYLAWVIAIIYFLKMVRQSNGIEISEGVWYFVRVAFFMALLTLCGDANRDGIRGDLINQLGNWGNSLAYGTINQQHEPIASYLGSVVDREKQTFNDNYKRFTENKIMVRINNEDMPIRYPDGHEGVRLLAAIYTGNPSTEDLEKLKSQAWQIGASFQFLNVGRGILEFGDYFLLLLQGFLVVAMRLAAPFMVAVAIDKQLAQRMSYTFGWGCLVVTLIMPALSQVLRYMAFSAGNIAFGVHSNQPYFIYDPTTNRFIAQGSPEYVILIAGTLMIILGLMLFASPFLSYRLSQGSFVEGVMSTFSGWFSSLTGLGLNAVGSYLGTQVGLEGERIANQGALDSRITEAGYARIAAQQSADAKFQADVVGAAGRYEGAFTNILGALNKDLIGVEAGRYQSQASSYAQAATQMATLNADEHEQLMRKALDTYLKNEGIQDEAAKAKILNEPSFLNLTRDRFDNMAGSVPVLGSAAHAIGVNGAWIDLLSGRPTFAQGDGKTVSQDSQLSLFKTPDGREVSFQDFVDKGILPTLGLPAPPKMPPVNSNFSPNLPPDFPTGGGIQPPMLGGGAVGGNFSGNQFPVSPDGTPLFKQSDPRWGSRTLGTSSQVDEAGCAMTSTAMAISKMSGRTVTPGQLDQYLDERGGYAGNAIKWDVAAGAVGLNAQKQNWSFDNLNKQLDAGKPVVMGVDWKAGSSGGANGTDHWVALTGRGVDSNGRAVYYANDPATGGQVAFYQNGNGLIGGERNYKTTGELVTFSGGSGAASISGTSFGGNWSTSANSSAMLPSIGKPANLPKTLDQPLNENLSGRAEKIPLSNESLVYYHPSQEAGFQSTGNKFYDSLILGAARTHGLNPNLVKAQFWQESKFDSNAVSNKGAGGIAQLMPATAERVGVTNRFDPAQSVYGGAKYMRYVADYMVAQGGARDGSSVRQLALAGYNAGEGAVQKHGFTVPNYHETKDYVARISGAVDQANKVNNPQLNPVLNGDAYVKDLSKYDKPTAEAMSKMHAAEFDKQTGMRRNFLDSFASNQITRQGYADKRHIAAANYQMQYQIADQYADYQRTGAINYANSQMKAAGINYQSEQQAARIGWQGSVDSANSSYTGTVKGALILSEAQMQAARLRALSEMIKSLGGSAGHMFSEAFEKFNRF